MAMYADPSMMAQQVQPGQPTAEDLAAAARRVFIGNVAWSTTSEELTALISQIPGCGAPVSCEVARTRTGRSIGYAIAELVTAEAAGMVIQTLNEYELAGRNLIVREDRAGSKPMNGSSEPTGKKCHVCGEVGHLKRDCPQNQGVEGGAPMQPKACHTCGGFDHLKRDCPQNAGVEQAPRACHICGELGHLKRDCPQNTGAQDKACHICGEVGHLKRDCPQGGAAM